MMAAHEAKMDNLKTSSQVGASCVMCREVPWHFIYMTLM